MQDLIYVAIIVAFFMLAAAFVKGCDLLIGPDDEALSDTGDEAEDGSEDDDLVLSTVVRR